ncbi:o-succinylbenzoate synthase [Rufibacter roseus]|uniref:O-succinylbenzoate synthase n=1 Tax=Rufibacter roseus TaxID=1567108 RepID=A0ABW2DPV4_9BACT|nr:o-succinylbenzoate synthase [Rufibacter roseus]
MPFVLTPFSRQLEFTFNARTSRGAMQTHQAHYLRLHHTKEPQKQGWGECSPLPGLSPDFSPAFTQKLQQLCGYFNSLQIEEIEDDRKGSYWQYLIEWPSICFAWETAWVDYFRGAKRMLYDNPFSRSEQGIKINGLIWMGDAAFMREQIEQKLKQGFSCLKLKIGGLNFEQELNILEEVRKIAGPEELEVRLDANGAFTPEDALKKLEQLARFSIHSLEQPVKPGQQDIMQQICEESPIPIALDEELIGVVNHEDKWKLLRTLQPAYIILKPTLLGGLISTREWIQVADTLQTKWWLTSALESNIGLNAIAQFSQDFDNPLPQGLGTGQLYRNNLKSPLEVRGQELWYNADQEWELPE